MTRLSDLTESEALAIIALPYKAAMYISHADDVEGEKDDEQERKAITRGLPELSKLHSVSPLVQDVAAEIQKLNEHWEMWENECFHITKQAPAIIQNALGHFGKDEMKHYRAFTIELGKMVAQAHSEFEAFDAWEEEKKESMFGSMISKITRGFTPGHEDGGNPANISPAENAALKELFIALKTPD